MDTANAVLEIAGADAFAAAISYASSHQNTVMLPTYVHTGTEYGDFGVIEAHVERLRLDLGERFKVRLLDLSVTSDAPLWRALNGRYMSALRDRFGFYSPCMGCHLYLHLMRIPEAAAHNCSVVVSGERTAHDSGHKINQTPGLLGVYQEVLREVSLSLEFPVSGVKNRSDFKTLAPWLWEEGEAQMECVLSGNYRSEDGTPLPISKEAEKRFIGEFLLPAGKKLAHMLRDGKNDYLDAVTEVIRSA